MSAVSRLRPTFPDWFTPDAWSDYDRRIEGLVAKIRQLEREKERLAIALIRSAGGQIEMQNGHYDDADSWVLEPLLHDDRDATTWRVKRK